MKNLKFLILPLLAVLIGCQNQQQEKTKPTSDVITKEEQSAFTPDEVISLLKEGNKRFVSGNLTAVDYNAQVAATAKGQYPKAIILSCLDSRVPVETVFDRGIGDIFVGRVAGNIENEDMLGSFEFGTELAGAKVIVVLGHSSCGAVKGAVDIAAVEGLGMENLNYLLGNISPAVDAVLAEGEERTSKNDDLVHRAVHENVKLTIERIKSKSEKLQKMEKDGDIKIVGAVYELSTGEVVWM